MEAGYKQLISYQLAQKAFDLGWDFVPQYFPSLEDKRQRDQIKQALRSHKQNIVEGSAERSLSRKLNLYDVAKSSGMEALEDGEDILRMEGLPRWARDDARLARLRRAFENFPPVSPPNPSTPPNPSVAGVLETLGIRGTGRIRRKETPEATEAVLNYYVDLLTRSTYLLDKQMNAVEQKHAEEGGYNENLLKKRLEFKRKAKLFSILLIPLLLLIPLVWPRNAAATTTLANQFTVAFWVNPTGSVASKALAVQNNQIRLYTDGSGYVNCAIYTTSWQIASNATSQPLAPGTWSHVACTYDKANIRLFINGSAQGTTPAQTGTVNDSGNVWKIGQDAGGTYGDLAGTIDDVRFYNYARSSAQISEDMRGSPEGSSLGQGRSFNSSVGYWKMDEGSGTTINNSGSGGSALNGTLGTGNSAPTWSQSGKFGKALSFDGSDDFISVPDGSALESQVGASGVLTVSAWVKPNNFSAARDIIDKYEYSNNVREYQFNLLATTGQLELFVTDATGTNYDSVKSTNSLVANQWSHVVSVYDNSQSGITNKIKLYINGKLETGIRDAYGGTFSQISDTAARVTIGSANAPSPTNFFAGTIDEVKIYPYALTLDEVKTEYNHGQAIKFGTLSTPLGVGNSAPDSAASMYCVPGSSDSCAAPVASWSFDENQGTTVADSSGNTNTGTWNGTGTHWAPGKLGPGGQFNGTSDYVNAGNGSVLNDIVTTTYEAWIYPTGWGGAGYGRIIDKSYKTLYVQSAAVGFKQWFTSGYGQWATTTTSVALNNWYHVAITYDSSSPSNAPTIYINGVKQTLSDASSAPSGSATSDASANLIIGDSNSHSRQFSGSLDQVQIFNYARTAAQVAWDYNKGGPVGWWKMDDCSGTTVRDEMFSTGSNNNGTLVVGALGSQNTVGNCNLGTGSSSPWGNGAVGKFNSSLNFDGTDDYVNESTAIANAQAVSFWAYPTTTSQSFLQLSSTGTVTSSSGVVAAGAGFASPTIYVNGKLNGTVTASAWNHIVVTTGTSFNANAIKFGLVGSTYYSGQLDDVRVYNYALTPSQIKTVYNGGSVVRFGPSTGTP